MHITHYTSIIFKKAAKKLITVKIYLLGSSKTEIMYTR